MRRKKEDRRKLAEAKHKRLHAYSSTRQTRARCHGCPQSRHAGPRCQSRGCEGRTNYPVGAKPQGWGTSPARQVHRRSRRRSRCSYCHHHGRSCSPHPRCLRPEAAQRQASQPYLGYTCCASAMTGTGPAPSGCPVQAHFCKRQQTQPQIPRQMRPRRWMPRTRRHWGALHRTGRRQVNSRTTETRRRRQPTPCKSLPAQLPRKPPPQTPRSVGRTGLQSPKSGLCHQRCTWRTSRRGGGSRRAHRGSRPPERRVMAAAGAAKWPGPICTQSGEVQSETSPASGGQ